MLKAHGTYTLNPDCPPIIIRYPPPQGSKYVEDPYTGARFQPQCEGEISPLGDFVKIGADASGLLVSQSQERNR